VRRAFQHVLPNLIAAKATVVRSSNDARAVPVKPPDGSPVTDGTYISPNPAGKGTSYSSVVEFNRATENRTVYRVDRQNGHSPKVATAIGEAQKTAKAGLGGGNWLADKLQMPSGSSTNSSATTLAGLLSGELPETGGGSGVPGGMGYPLHRGV
jgi:hypothetical protein